MNTSPETLKTALAIVASASHVARVVQRDLENIRQITKDDRSPVTVADFAVQAIVGMELNERLGAPLIVGEENADALRQPGQEAVCEAVHQAVRRHRPDITLDQVLDAIDLCNHDAKASHYWTLDPIDGTKGFLRGQQYAIALGLIEDGQVTMGIMGCPNLPSDHALPLDQADDTGTLYGAIKDQGAWEYELNTELSDKTRRSIRAGTYQTGADIRTCGSVEKAHSKQSDTQRILEHLQIASTPVRLDSQCKYAVVARNQADAYFRMPTSSTYVEKIWDHAAGSLIATEAGAIVSDILGQPLDFSQGWGLTSNRGVIGAVPGLHEQIIESIEKLGIAETVKA
ncbi:MAG: 3'(2'),5'-bisphosphate nucleotidase [Planctomycetota bacterium]|nr:3'(2'),5'-bisphosphate nucleotidase [Planctomycetota bacterium]